MGFFNSLKNAWNAFLGRDPTTTYRYHDIGPGTTYRPDRHSLGRSVNRSIVSTIYNKIAVDCSMIDIMHVRLNEENRYVETLPTPLNTCLTLTANIDQTGRSLIQDIVMSMFDEGVVAVIPIVTDKNPNYTESYDIHELRVGKILEWYPKHIRVKVYNDQTGLQEEITVQKKMAAIIENPFYATMNEPNGVSQRLIRILSQLDRTNEQNSSGKLDMIIQLPYVIKGSAREKQAEERRQSIVAQLTNSQYGIAYIDGTEKVTQLGRSIENNLWEQATQLTQQLYNQFGLTESIFNGTASEAEQLNYHNATIDPILSTLTLEMTRKFLTKTAITQHQAIKYYKDPFRLVPVNQLAEIADKMTRNEIMTSNEIRSVVGMKPSNDPRADQLINANINQSKGDERLEGNQMMDENIPQDDDPMVNDAVRRVIEANKNTYEFQNEGG